MAESLLTGHFSLCLYDQRLYFLKQLKKRAEFPRAQLLHFYISVIRPVLEYAVPVWHHLLTKTQTNSIESVQKRALRIIYYFQITSRTVTL